MKKIFASFSAVILLFCMAVFAAGADTPSYDIKERTVEVGTQFTVPIDIKNNSGIISLRLKIIFDNSVLELVKVENTKLLNGFTTPTATMTSPYTLRWADSLAKTDNKQNGTVAVATFRVKSNTDSDSTVIGIEHTEARTYAGNKVTFADVRKIINLAKTHSFSEYVSDNNATCTADGTKTAYCDYGCGTKSTVTDSGSALGHAYTNTVKNATCTAEGLKTFTCSHCGDTYTQTIPKIAHSEVTLAAKSATCTQTGLTEGKKCSVCGTVTVAQKTVAKKEHNCKNVTTKATLSKNGKIESKCTDCGYVKSTSTIYYPKTVKLSATKYLYNAKVKTPSVTVTDSKGNTLKKDTDYTVAYSSGRKNTGKYTVTVKFKGKYSGTKNLYFYIIPSKTNKITATVTTSSIKSTWQKVTGASGYKAELLNSKNKVLKTAVTTETSYTFKNLSKATTYKVRVTAYKTIDGKKMYSTVSTTLTTSTAPDKVTFSKVTPAGKQATPIWKTVGGASGYEVQYSTSSKFKNAKTATVKGGSTQKTTIKNLSKGKKYYFRVRAYKLVDNKKVYGAWSSAKSTVIK